MMTDLLRTAWLFLAIVSVAGAAWMFRFDPVGGNMVWDRWHQKSCMVYQPMAVPLCVPDQ